MARERELVRKELRNYPDGELMLSREGDHLFKYLVSPYPDADGRTYSRKKGIGRSPELVRRLARKRFLEEYMKRIDRNILLIDDLAKKLVPTASEDVLQGLPKHFECLPKEYLFEPAVRNRKKAGGPAPDDVSEIQAARLWLTDMSPAEWGTMAYRQNALHADNKRIVAAGGMRFRSKSEAAIAARYEYYGLPYHYDEVLRLEPSFKEDLAQDGPACRPIYVSPDFITVRKDGRIIYHEHLGLAGSPEYTAGFLQKLKNYMRCGIVPWDDLLITYDDPDGGLDLELVDALFRNRGLIN